MTREQYLMMRKGGNFNIIYEFYKDHYDHDKHKQFLSLEQLAQTLPMFGDPNLIFEKCCKYYDEKFKVIIIKDKEGKTIANV
jgi:hypothetical protein